MTRALATSILLAATSAAAQPSMAPADDAPATPGDGAPMPTEPAPGLAPDPAPPDDPEEPPIRPDPRAVSEAREANLEPESSRSGLAVGFALGPNIQLGFGISESSGTGGGLAIRFGTVASPRWVWLAELASTGYQQVDEDGKTRINSSTLFTLGGQLYVKEAFWLRGGGGLANFARRTRTMDPTASFWGVGVIGAGGLDLLRRHSLALSIEILTTAARYRDGWVTAGAMQLGVSWY